MAASRERVPLGLAHAPLRDQVREELRQRITDGRLAPGSKMVERELAAELGVSRVPVREALRMLETDGFVQVVPRRGVIVRTLARKDVEELFDVREALEVLASRGAATRASATELADIRRILEQGERAIKAGDNEKAAQSNEAFHDRVVALAHNDLLASMLEPLQGRLHWLFRQVDDLADLAREHQELYRAIATRDPHIAGTAALEHVRLNRDIALHLLFGDDDEAARAQA